MPVTHRVRLRQGDVINEVNCHLETPDRDYAAREVMQVYGPVGWKVESIDGVPWMSEPNLDYLPLEAPSYVPVN